MEITYPHSNTGQLTHDTQISIDNNLGVLLAANAAIARQKSRYPTWQAEIETLTMRRPLDMPRTFSYLGLMLGLFPPLTLFTAFMTQAQTTTVSPWVVLLLLWVNLVTTAMGYFLGKSVGRELAKLGERSFSFQLLLTVIAGFLWGAISGASGGVFIFIVGVFFGGVIGGIVGAVALPVFYAFHTLVKRNGMIELRHFLPIASGVTFSICAIVLRIIGV